MKKISPILKSREDFEKVYENPLDWCPIFGYIPEIENTHLAKNVEPFEIGILCKKNITEARLFLLGPLNIPEIYHHAESNVALPKIKSSIWPSIECKTIRNLFQNLDYLALWTSNNEYIINLRSCGVINEFSPTQKPIGRTSNLDINVTPLSCAASKINLNNEDIHVHKNLLFEAQKITGRNIDLSLEILFALFAILESWIALTSLLQKPETHQQKRRIFEMQQKAQCGTDLLNKAYYYALEEQAKFSSREFRTNFKEKQKISEKKKKCMKKNRKDREILKGVPVMLEKWIEYYKTINKRPTASQFFRHLLKYFCIDDDLIKALLREEDVPTSEDIKPLTEQTANKCFYETNDRGKVFYIGILPDNTDPMNYKTAQLSQTTEKKDGLGYIKHKPISFGTFQNYYTKQNPNPRKAKQKS